VGKTSLLRALQEEKTSSPDALRNVSTNGVTVTTLNLSRPISNSLLPSLTSSKKPKGSQKERVRCNVWDFGGQSVFHSTHRFFITPFAVYVVLYDMSKPETYERLKYAFLLLSFISIAFTFLSYGT
jgi:internalin A